MSLEEKKKARYKLLKGLYDATGGDELKWLPLFDLGGHVGLDREQTDQAGAYLKGEGLLAFRAFGPLIGITHQGIKEIEQAIEHPDRPTDHFLPINFINIGTMIGSTIQQAGHSSNLVANRADYDSRDLQKLMSEIRAAVEDPKFPDDARREILADVGTVEQQLTSPKTKWNIVAEAKKSIRNVLEGIGAGIIANGIVERLKGG